MQTLPVLASAPSLVVHQRKEALEIFTDWETANRYVVQLESGQPVLYAAEGGRGIWASIVRSFWKSGRPFEMQLRDGSGNIHLQLDRPFTLWLNKLWVRDGRGQLLGLIQQNFTLLRRRFSIQDAHGQVLATIEGPVFRPWTFRVLVEGRECGVISKTWGGVLREAFTDADTFAVRFGPEMSPALRSLALAATFLIDFLYFEDHD